jgi:seryl-tRNA synthetase
MFDLNIIRENPQDFDSALARRGVEGPSAAILALDGKHRAIQTRMQEAQSRRNSISKEIGALKSRGEDASKVMAEVGQLKADIKGWEEDARAIGAELNSLLMGLPNVPLDDVPDGADESENVVVRTVGKPIELGFEGKEHFELGETLGMMDFESAAGMSGSRFVILKGALARLERAIGQFMLDLHVSEHGYQEIQAPVLVRDKALLGTGQLPKFADDLFKTDNGYWMIPTAEVTLTNLHHGEIIEAESLPRRYTALSACFRSEAGSAGRDTRGMIRQHQFNKVELVSFVAPEKGLEELKRMTRAAEEVLKRLGLVYRVVELCTGDMGFGAQKTFDLEVWLPGQGCYREISSCSLCGAFQARRMNTRFRAKGEKHTQFPYTLNGSGVAAGRALVAVMETCQQADGSIIVPQVLAPYMGGTEIIKA